MVQRSESKRAHFQARELRAAAPALLLAVLAFNPACGDDDGGNDSAAGSNAGAAAGAPVVGGAAGAPGAGGAAGIPAGGAAGTPAGGSGGTPAGGQGGAGASTARLGGFAVNVKVDEGVTTVAGALYDDATPENVIWNLRAEAGGCSLFAREAPFCDPACGSKVCVAGNQCVSSPNPVEVGNVRVEGLGSSAFTMTPSMTKSYSPPDGVTIPYPPTADGAPIRVVADGGSLGAFTLEGKGISPFELTSATPAAIEDGKPLVLTWNQGANPDARIVLELDLSHHGGSKAKITCDVADTGSLEVSADLLDQLIGIGVSGFPVVELGRVATSSASVTGGLVELTVASRTRVDITVPGLVSCYGDEECPTGQTCQPDFRCK